MKLIKINLTIVAVLSAIMILIAIWSNSRLSVDTLEGKLLCTLWLFLAIGTTREVCKMSK